MRRLFFHKRSKGGVYFRPAFILDPAFILGNTVINIFKHVLPLENANFTRMFVPKTPASPPDTSFLNSISSNIFLEKL